MIGGGQSTRQMAPVHPVEILSRPRTGTAEKIRAIPLARSHGLSRLASPRQYWLGGRSKSHEGLFVWL